MSASLVRLRQSGDFDLQAYIFYVYISVLLLLLRHFLPARVPLSSCRRGKSHLFYTLTMFHKISVKKVTKSFQLDVTNGEKSSIIILKCTILYKISEISNWRQINQSKMR